MDIVVAFLMGAVGLIGGYWFGFHAGYRKGETDNYTRDRVRELRLNTERLQHKKRQPK